MLGVTLRPRTAHSLWTNGKIETQNQHIAHFCRSFLNDAGTNWASLGPKFAFAHITSVNYTTGKPPYKVVFGAKPQVPMSVKLGLYRNKHKLCCSEFCTNLPPHTHENSTRNELLQNLLRSQLSQALLNQERDFERVFFQFLNDVGNKQPAPMHSGRDLNWDVIWMSVKRFFTKTTGKTYQKLKNYNSDDWVHLVLPNVQLLLLIKSKTTKTHQS